MDRAVAARIVAKLEAAAVDPTRFFSRLVGGPEWRLRVGDWRVIAVLVFERRAIWVQRVEHRSRVYR